MCRSANVVVVAIAEEFIIWAYHNLLTYLSFEGYLSHSHLRVNTNGTFYKHLCNGFHITITYFLE